MDIRAISKNYNSKSFEVHYEYILYKYNSFQFQIFLYRFFNHINKLNLPISSEFNMSTVLLIEKIKNKETVSKVEKEILEILYNVTLKKEGDCNFT